MIGKTVWEEFYRTFQFGGVLGAGETITVATVTAATIAGVDVTAEMIAAVAPYDDTQVRYFIKGGTTGNDYLLTIRAETSLGQKFEERLPVRIH